jgi:hypothetical protein
MRVLEVLNVPKPDKPEPKRACLEITNYKFQITNQKGGASRQFISIKINAPEAHHNFRHFNLVIGKC